MREIIILLGVSSLFGCAGSGWKACHYGCIETNGTGEAAFRKMYYNFLEKTGNESGNTFIIGAAKGLEPAVDKWTKLAFGMKNLSEDKRALKNSQELKTKLAKLSHTAEDIYKTEKEFYDYIALGGR
ncbi:MAG: DUF4872 domain-containing protein [Spirochaetales bacterium]|nr:DUF4872 domain-containing protein [Spirochaetales bacterium]